MSPDSPQNAAQQKVLALIAAGSTARAAAEAAGVHRNTVANWLCSSEFREAMAEAQYEKALAVRDHADSLAAEAYNVIRAMLTDPAVPAAIRLKAALGLIDRSSGHLPPLTDEPLAEIPENVHKNAQLPETDGLQSKPEFPPGRNQACPCGSGMKFKRCCLRKAAPEPSAAPSPVQKGT
jgi:hypothetical protein